MTVERNVVCTFCGCLCDDINLTIEDDRIVKVEKACGNGRGLFEGYNPDPIMPKVMGRDTTFQEAVKEASRMLRSASYPLIYGLSSTSSEAQRMTVQLAELIGASIDSTSSVCHGPTGLAMQAVGEPTCTLGEIKNRADLLVFWGCNPLVTHSRHFARYSAMPKGRFIPEGRRDRKVVVVDVRRSETAKSADMYLQIKQGCDFEVLLALKALIMGRTLDAVEVGGIPAEVLQQLAVEMKSCRYGVIFFGMGLTMTNGRDLNVRGVLSLVRELNDHTRFSALPMRGHGNVTGADQVMSWLCGYPFAVNYSRGYPRYGPGEYTAVDLLCSGEADCMLVIASDPAAHFPAPAVKHMKTIPVIAIDPAESLTAAGASVYFPTAMYGIDCEGTAYRMDGVALRLKAPLKRKRPSDEEVLQALIEGVKSC